MNLPLIKSKPTRTFGKKKKNLQKRVLERDNFTCRICNCYTKAPPHHIIYISQGGNDTMENMVTICGVLESDCHKKIHSGKIKCYGTADSFQFSYTIWGQGHKNAQKSI